MRSKSEWNERVKKKGAEREADRVSRFMIGLAHAAPPMEVLTTSEPWNKYLEYLQGQIEETEKRLEGYREKLTDPSILDPEGMLYAKVFYLRLQERLHTLKFVMQIPKHLVESGKIARDQVGNLGGEMM